MNEQIMDGDPVSEAIDHPKGLSSGNTESRQTRLDAVTTLMWNAMQEYASSLTALGAAGVHGLELHRREQACYSMRIRFLRAKSAVDALSRLKADADAATDPVGNA